MYLAYTQHSKDDKINTCRSDFVLLVLPVLPPPTPTGIILLLWVSLYHTMCRTGPFFLFYPLVSSTPTGDRIFLYILL